MSHSIKKRSGRKATLKGRPHKSVAAENNDVLDNDGIAIPAQPKPKKKKKNEPNTALRILLQIISFHLGDMINNNDIAFICQ